MELNEDTIVALATPPGAGGIAIVRLSGSRARQIAPHLHTRAKQAIKKPRQLVLGDVLASGRPLDQGLVVSMPAPNSYTGEDVVELQLHGSPVAAAKLIEAALSKGARLAEPGEFTKRAYLNGKLDLIQAEAVADLIAADTEAALQQAQLKASGTISAQIEELRDRIVALIAKLSANLDFGEEDIPDINSDEVGTDIANMLNLAREWLAGAKSAAIIRDGLRVAIVGLPNAGKSSLLNALAGYDRAIVTAIAGTTRDTLEERITVNGLAVMFVDTAGLRDTSDLVESQGVERSQAASRQAHLVLVAASADQNTDRLRQQLKALNMSQSKLLAVQTKADLYQQAIKWPFKTVASVVTSAKTGQGMEELRQTIYSLGVESSTPESAAISGTRQINCLKSCAHQLSEASRAVEQGAPLDVIAGELTLAAEQLGGLLGRSVGQAVINQIFSNFCIGK